MISIGQVDRRQRVVRAEVNRANILDFGKLSSRVVVLLTASIFSLTIINVSRIMIYSLC